MEVIDSGLIADNNWQAQLKANKFVILIGLVGLFLLTWGIVSAVKQSSQENQVEIISADSSADKENINGADIIVDVAGAVQSPGVYQFPPGSRINDALVAAGGLSASADRVWVNRYLNRANALIDGSKIYIPHEGENINSTNTSQLGAEQPNTSTGKTFGVSQGIVAGSTTGININTASASELDALWGIGTARAEQIINNRPYNTLEELITKAGIPQNVYERIVNEISL